MKERVRQRALALGFDDCRVADAAPLAEGTHLTTWLAAGHQAGMAWMERTAAKRSQPELVLPGLKSVISLAVSYAAREPAPDSGRTGPAGVVARYARFADYHDALAAPLRELADFVVECGGPGTRALWYVDTGPVMERALAQRGGLGFAGKHTNLISRRLGDWFFIAEILTTLELAPDEPGVNHCGRCTRCLAACPTGALRAPFTLDARRCISYLTIELKGSIPVEIRPLLGTRIFGCDDCLAVCPWNRFAREARLMAPIHRPDLAQAPLFEWLALDETTFRARFAGTPLIRAKRRGLLRNVCVALGNSAGAEALPALAKAATDAEPLVREHASWAMEMVQGRAGQPPRE